jgi:hypothetical protein
MGYIERLAVRFSRGAQADSMKIEMTMAEIAA